MVVSRLIERKRDGNPLAPEEWRELILRYTRGEVPDYQMAALAMAVVFRGLTPEELEALTDALLRSGERLDGTTLPGPRVDKHSTGGVGDKTSLVLAPLLAALDVVVPMVSGRGLGHTGGTLDKLEAIPGFRTQLSLAEARAQLRRIGVVMLGQTPELVPADRKLYALRDVTGTVESVPLIAASIMAKKLAEDLDGLVVDVKVGHGAFLTDPAESRRLAELMIGLGEAHGCRTVALLTAMDRPLGWACGNALETAEALRALAGGGPPDLMEVTEALGVEMLLLAGKTTDRSEARRLLRETIASGRALERMRQLVEAQGGDAAVVDDPNRLPAAPVIRAVQAPDTGRIAAVDPRIVGHAIVELGGGRRRVEDAVDPAVGFVIAVKPGDAVAAGQLIGTVHARDEAGAAFGAEALRRAVQLGDRVRVRPLVSHRITREGVEEIAASDGP